ncbi:MAG: TylF/MycF/NovP-related O-methyltransferase [Rubrobacteraceae bacterium]
MPVYRNQTIFEMARGVKAFLKLDAGLTRGEVPDFEQEFKQAQERMARKDRRIAALQKELAGRGAESPRNSNPGAARASRTLPAGSTPAPQEPTVGHPGAPKGASNLYLDLMKRSLRDTLHGDDREKRNTKWHATAHTMLPFVNLDTLRFCIEDVLKNEVPGDFIEAGVWRGGATIFMRAVLKAHGVEDRTVWVADSFEGLPKPDLERYPDDAGAAVVNLHTQPELAISLQQVRSNFSKYGLLDGQVRFLKGWFSETLPNAPIERLAVVRLDGDMYESTMDSLTALYPKLSAGGYLIVDDYIIPACRKAVHDYREKCDIREEIQRIDHRSVYWRRTEA